MNMSRLHAVFLVVLMFSALSGETNDENLTKRKEFDAGPLTSQWIVWAGGNFSAYDTSVSWAPKGHGGAVIFVEDTLGLDTSTDNYIFGVAYRFNRRHSVELSATDSRRSAFKVIDAEIEWGDYIFRADGELYSEFNMSLVSLKYKYDFSDSGRLNAGFSAGLSTFSIAASLSGEARVEDDDGGEWLEGVVERADIVAPVPLIGFYLEYAMTPRWILYFDSEVIDLEVSGHKGRVLKMDMVLEYVVTDVFGIGIGLGGIDMQYRGDEDGEIFGVDYSIKTLGAYLSFAF